MGRSRNGQNQVRPPCSLTPIQPHVFIRVIAQVDAQMVKPAPERPYEGVITIVSELSPMTSTEYEPGR